MPEMSGPNQWRFRGHASCQQLTRLTLERLAHDQSFGRVRQFRKGTYVWRADDRADRVYALIRGQVAILAADSEGHEVINQVIDAGQTFGELCFCSEEQGLRLSTARVVKEAEVAEVTFDKFVEYLQHDSNATASLILTFCSRLAESEKRIEVLSYRGAEDRLARLLIQLAGSRGRANANRPGEVILAVSHDEISLLAAMTRPHVSVTMGKLRNKGLVEYKRGSQLTFNPSRLTSFVNQRKTEKPIDVEEGR